MTDRALLAHSFLDNAGWSNAKRSDLAGDASNRRYERLIATDGTPAVLMDAPPERGEDVRPFVHIAEFLLEQGLSAPKILAQDTRNGFLLLEDLGDALFARVVQADANREPELYEAATEVLISLHQTKPPLDLQTYDAKIMAEMAAHAWRWYLRGNGADYEDQAREFERNFETVLAENLKNANVLIQRDYHAENLLWLPDRDGVAKVGLLDFQDAMIGHRAYDLVSLLQDARRDVSPAIEAQMVNHYITQTGQDETQFLTAYNLLGLQRNLRILGVFARLSLHFGKAHYVDLIPRVWHHVQTNLAHPAAADFRDIILQQLPEPTPELLQKLRDQCGTVPTL